MELFLKKLLRNKFLFIFIFFVAIYSCHSLKQSNNGKVSQSSNGRVSKKGAPVIPAGGRYNEHYFLENDSILLKGNDSLGRPIRDTIHRYK